MKNINRKFNWVSSLDHSKLNELEQLQLKLVEYYSHNQNYYKEIDFTAEFWSDPKQLLHQDTLTEIEKAEKILELGCGAANILKTGKIDLNKYTGVEFSEKIIKDNIRKYPKAKFIKIDNPYDLPINNDSYDIVFSFFVIEHTVFPHKFLLECLRVLKKNGKLILLAPDFLGRSKLSSQRVGFSSGTGRTKIKEWKLLDGLVTGYDNKVRLVTQMSLMRIKANKNPKFFINLSPTCFIDPFNADIDAVYITYEKEIKEFLIKNMSWLPLEFNLDKFAKKNMWIYLKGIKI